jgi:hypothetical protein
MVRFFVEKMKATLFSLLKIANLCRPIQVEELPRYTQQGCTLSPIAPHSV